MLQTVVAGELFWFRCPVRESLAGFICHSTVICCWFSGINQYESGLCLSLYLPVTADTHSEANNFFFFNSFLFFCFSLSWLFFLAFIWVWTLFLVFTLFLFCCVLISVFFLFFPSCLHQFPKAFVIFLCPPGPHLISIYYFISVFSL